MLLPQQGLVNASSRKLAGAVWPLLSRLVHCFHQLSLQELLQKRRIHLMLQWLLEVAAWLLLAWTWPLEGGSFPPPQGLPQQGCCLKTQARHQSLLGLELLTHRRHSHL
jgi:hypothetical protein